MAIGDSPEMLRMQEEAMNRAREMYLRANPTAAQTTTQTARAANNQTATATATRAETQQGTNTTQRQASPRTVPLSMGNTGSERNTAERTAQTNTNLQASSSAPNAPSILNTLMEDKDRTLILMLLVLLSGEGQSNELMFALLFLLI
ncbi:hypothetical protein [Scatolibacter rhodanostii]|uniref:hypothetical protein n=1 Tax=Scatolibacter rhodanostii TaxID=2014781 RepID=UPI000C0735C8|nr:hypothetical protein [Scatolibacter rhodanostii]